MAALPLVVVTTEGQRIPAKAGTRVQVAFERQFKVGLGKAIADQRVEYLYWLAWEALRRSAPDGGIPPFDTWLDGVEDVELEESDDRPLGAEA